MKNGLMLARIDDDGVSRYDYDDQRNLVAAIDPEGQRTRYDYDAAGRRVRTTTPRLALEHSYADNHSAGHE